MLRKLISMACIAAGMAMMLTALSGGAAPQPAHAQSVPQPTPRPPLPPDDKGGSGIGTGSGMGHIAGTVIDLTTGAPTSNVVVAVGPYLLPTDGNGNYDSWLPAGTYTVTLMIEKERGTAAQPAIMLTIPVADRVVQHLSFYEAQPAAAPADQVQPAAPTAQPAVMPTAMPTPEPAPPSKARAPEAPANPAPEAAAAPSRLPRTGDDLPAFWLYMSIGVVLMGAGLFVGARADSLHIPAIALAGFARRQQRRVLMPAADAAALLAALLTSEVRAAQRGRRDDELLAALLTADADRRRRAQHLLAELLTHPVMSA
jgi:hypothetical protein